MAMSLCTEQVQLFLGRAAITVFPVVTSADAPGFGALPTRRSPNGVIAGAASHQCDFSRCRSKDQADMFFVCYNGSRNKKPGESG